MKIKEVEEITGINASTLRYYEEEGLLSPERNATNSYREYSESDLQRLNKIKFLRNLQMNIKTISGILNNTIQFEDAIKLTLEDLKKERENLDLSIQLLEMLQDENEISSEVYTNRIFDFYKPHPVIHFFDNISNKISQYLPFLRMGFLPEEGINSKEDFIFELIHYAKREDKKLEILEDTMMPRLRINDVEMQAILVPTRLSFNYRIVKFKVQRNS